MGKNNRQNRAAKQRQRRRSGAERGGQSAHRFDHEAVAAAMVDSIGMAVLAAADSHAGGYAEAARECVTELAGPRSPFGVATIAQVVESQLAWMVDAVVGGGWRPLDLHQITVRKLSPAHLPLLAAMVAVQASRHPARSVHPQWRAQIAELGVDQPRGAPDLVALGRGRGLDGLATLTLAVELLGLLGRTPKLAPVLPPPGSYEGSMPEVTETEARLLARVRALLAKAESTEYAEEAEALTAKAQDLMTRHSLQLLIHQHGSKQADRVTAARLWLDAPYAAAKSLVVNVVAEANRCRAVWADSLGCITVLGRAADLASVELLCTSLLVQATRAMLERQPATGRRTRSYRQSFLVSFATRIGERLRGAADGVTKDLSATDRAALLPVLRSASERVDQAFAESFPYTVEQRVNVSNGTGWAAGRAAADLALLDVQLQVTPGADPRLAESA